MYNDRKGKGLVSMEVIREKIAAYMEALKLRGVSQNTAVSYGRDLRRLADYLEAAGCTQL